MEDENLLFSKIKVSFKKIHPEITAHFNCSPQEVGRVLRMHELDFLYIYICLCLISGTFFREWLNETSFT